MYIFFLFNINYSLKARKIRKKGKYFTINPILGNINYTQLDTGIQLSHFLIFIKQRYINMIMEENIIIQIKNIFPVVFVYKYNVFFAPLNLQNVKHKNHEMLN